MTTRITDKPSKRPVTESSVLDYLNREVSKALWALIDRVNALVTRSHYVVTAEPSASVEIDWSETDTAELTLNQNTVLTFVDPDVGDNAALLRLLFHQPAAHTVTWPASVAWSGGAAPTIAADSTVVLLLFFDGAYYGVT